MMDNGQNKLQS